MPVTTWTKNDLSVTPPSFQMGAGDREVFGFDAGEPVTGATFTFVRLRPFDLPPLDASAAIAASAFASPVASLAIHNLVANETYRLTVTFTNAAGRRWSRMLFIECV